MTIQELQQLIEESKKAIPNNPVLSSRQPALPPDRSTISARHPYEVTLPYNQIGPFPSNMSAGAPRGEVAYDPRSYAKETALGLPPMAGLYAGAKALGYASAPRKFSNLADKMERFEISDEGARLAENVPRNPFNKELVNIPMFSDYKLKDILNHPELYKNYPEIANLPVKSTGLNWTLKGAYDDVKNTMYMAGGKPEDFMNNLIHEIQHYIQTKEGFARGANTEMFLPKNYKELKKMVDDEIKPIEKGIEGQVKNYNTYTVDAILENLEKGRKLLPYQEKLYSEIKLTGKLDDLIAAKRKQIELHSIEMDAVDKYMKSGGEIESRDSAFRRLYTDYERMTTQPGASQNIPLSEYIVNKR